MAAYARSTASISTSAGTISTTYATSVVSGELDFALRLAPIDLSPWEVEDDEEETVKKLECTKGLLDGFRHGDGDMGALERWLSEMGVGWILGLADDASAGTASSLLRSQRNLAESWIRALTEITESTLRVSLHSIRLVLVEGHPVVEPDVPCPVQLVRFVQATVLKMLPFIDALLLATADHDTSSDVSNGAQALSVKLQTLLDVRDALSSASEGIQLCFRWDSTVEMEAQRGSDEVLGLLSAKEHRMDEAIWNTMEEVRTGILTPEDDIDWRVQTLQGSSDICKVTRSLISYIKSLWNYYWLLNHIVRTAAELGKYVPECDISSYLVPNQDKTDHFTTLTMDMVSCLQVNLAKRSEYIPDHGLRFLFLINNTHFICQQLHPLFRMKRPMAVLASKIEGYITKYLQVSWTPVLSCLYNRTPHCFGANSAMPKFDLKFQKTYTAQKLWKVPDPELRTRLRKAIIERVVSALTKYVEDNNITDPGVTPQEREMMLLELFEG